MSESQFEKLLKKNGQLKEEVEQLRSLVREAYGEGFNDGGLAAHPMQHRNTWGEPQHFINWEDSWKASESRENLGDE